MDIHQFTFCVGCVFAMIFIFLMFSRDGVEFLMRQKQRKEPFLNFNDVVAVADAECTTENCFVYLPKHRKHIFKRIKKKKNDSGLCVSNHDGKRYTCMSNAPNFESINETLAELDNKTRCDGNPTTYCYMNSENLNSYLKKFYRREYDPVEGECVWKDIHTEETVPETQIMLCSKERIQCSSRDYTCGNGTRIRHQINSKGDCQALNTCSPTCDTSRKATCYQLDPTGRVFNPSVYSYTTNRDSSISGCEYYDSRNRSMPNVCMYNTILECGSNIKCNGNTYVGRPTNGGARCEYAFGGNSINGISECSQTCASNQYYDYETDACQTCGAGMFLEHPEAHTFDSACVPYVNCEEQYTPCFEKTDEARKYVKVLYQKIHDANTNTCKNAYDLKSPCYTTCSHNLIEENGKEYCVPRKDSELYDIKNVP